MATPLLAEVEKAKKSDQAAITYALKKLKKTEAYITASTENQEKMKSASKAAVQLKRYITHLLLY